MRPVSRGETGRLDLGPAGDLVDALVDGAPQLAEHPRVVDRDEAPRLGVAGVGRQGGEAHHLAHVVARHRIGREPAHAVAALDGGLKPGKVFGQGAANHHVHMVPEQTGGASS